MVVNLLQLDARLTEERAELVASNGLLDQNERLRAAIVAEEREKFESEKVSEPPLVNLLAQYLAYVM